MLEIKQDDNKDDYKDDHSDDNNQVWRSCCFEIDSHFTSYIGQLLISFSILTFSFIMLIKADGDCNKSSSYINLISFLLGKILSSVQSSVTEKK